MRPAKLNYGNVLMVLNSFVYSLSIVEANANSFYLYQMGVEFDMRSHCVVGCLSATESEQFHS